MPTSVFARTAVILPCALSQKFVSQIDVLVRRPNERQNSTGDENMSAQSATVETGGRQLGLRRKWLIAGHDLRSCQKEFAPRCHQLSTGDSFQSLVKSHKNRGVAVPDSTMTSSELSPGQRTFMIKSAYRLVGLIGVPLVVAVYLLPQLHALPNSSLSYSLLYALISLLFNISSSALLRVF